MPEERSQVFDLPHAPPEPEEPMFERVDEREPTNTLVNDITNLLGGPNALEAAHEPITGQEFYSDFEPQTKVNEDYIDVRTGLPYGQYSEEELKKEAIDTATIDTIFDPAETHGDRMFKKIMAERNPDTENQLTHIGEVITNHFDFSTLNYKALMLYGQLSGDIEKDSAILEEAAALDEEAAAARGKLPAEYPKWAVVDKVVSASAEVAGLMVGLGGDILPDVARDAAMGGLTGVAAGATTGPLAPATSVAGGLAGASISGTASAMLRSTLIFKQMGKGEMVRGMITPEEGEEPIPLNIAVPIAEKLSTVYALSETIGITAALSTVGISSAIGERIVAIAGEGATEALQTIMEQYSAFLGREELARVRGQEFTEDFMDTLDVAEVQSASSQGIYGTVGMTSPGATVSAGAKTVEILKDRSTKQKAQAKAEAADAAIKANNEKVAKAQETNTLVDTEPISRPEANRVKNDVILKGTTVTNDKLDGLATTPVEDMGAAIEELEAEVADSISDPVVEFFGGIAEFLGNQEQADAIQSITDARAQSSGFSLSEYVEYHGLEFEEAGRPDDKLNATITFTEDNRTIIKAFTNGDVTSIVHELGHVFRKDLDVADQGIADEFVGVESGTVWDDAAEEKFARAWESYIATAEAPSTALAKVFGKLNAWMTNIYKTLKGSPIDVPMTPEMKGVFDRLLVRSEVTKSNVDSVKVDAEMEENTLAQTRVEDSDAAAILRVKRERQAYNRAEKSYRKALSIQLADPKSQTTVGAIKAQKISRAVAMQEMFDSGDMHGYRAARAQMKAFLTRERSRYATQRKHKYTRDSIKKKLKRGLPKKEAGKMAIRIGEKLSTVLTEANKVISPLTTNKLVRAEYDKRLGGGQNMSDMVTQEAEWIVNTYLTGAVLRNTYGLQMLQQLDQNLGELIKGDFRNSPLFLAKAEVEAMVPETVHDINGGHVPDSPSQDTRMLHKARQEEKTKAQKIATSTFGVYVTMGFGSMINRVTSYSSNARSNLTKELDFFQAKQGTMTMVREQSEKMFNVYGKNFGLTSGWAINNKMKADSAPVHEIGDGLKYSVAGLRQLYMYASDPTLDHRLVDQFGGREAYEQVKLNVADILTEEDVAFAEAMMQFYQSDEQYSSINVVYRRLFGTDLPRVSRYVPVRAQGFLDRDAQLEQAQKYTQFEHDDFGRRTPTSTGRIKARHKSANTQLQIDGDLSLYGSYVQDMAQFINFGEQGRKAKLILDHPEVKKAIKVEYGDTMYKYIMESLDDILADGINIRNQNRMFDNIRTAFVRSTIGLALSVSGKQLISAVQVAQNMPITDFAKGVALFWKNPIKNVQEMLDVEYLRNRSSLVDRDLKAAQFSAAYTDWKLNPTFTKWLMLNVTIGDSLAIAAGGWVLNNYLKGQVNGDTGQKYTKEEALLETTRIMESTQQSGSMQELSPMQRGGTWAQFMTMYGTGPTQATRQSVEAIKDYAAGRISRGQMIKTLAIYWGLVPLGFAAASMVVSDDYEDPITKAGIAMALGPFGAMFTIGKGVNEAVRRALEMQRYEVDNPFFSVADDILGFLGDLATGNFEDLTFDDGMGMLQGVSVLSGHGLPIQRAGRILQQGSEFVMEPSLTGDNTPADVLLGRSPKSN